METKNSILTFSNLRRKKVFDILHSASPEYPTSQLLIDKNLVCWWQTL